MSKSPFLFCPERAKRCNFLNSIRYTSINQTKENIMDRVDLFEQYETLPVNVKNILDKFNVSEDTDGYESCANLVKELNAIGYTCEYYLDAEPFGLRKMIKKGDSYTYGEIVNFSLDKGLDDAEFTLQEMGEFQIGVQFLILDHNEKDQVASFVLTGVQGDNSVYECVYTDFE